MTNINNVRVVSYGIEPDWAVALMGIVVAALIGLVIYFVIGKRKSNQDTS
jgi:phosphotransferase system  glucose/maltose/N-acetylglucosamine-specific IIC component